jgi:uncharacterized protein YgbK (DUF1537 family)
VIDDTATDPAEQGQTTPAQKWLVVADDVTGALDTAVGFAGSGVVEYSRTAPTDVDVAAVSTGSRASSAPVLVDDALIDREVFDRLYVKIDSTVRGRPREHLGAAMDAWHPRSTAIICPAAPALGRTVVGGRVYVHGEPAAASAAGRDPVAPTLEDRLTVVFHAPLIAPSDLAEAIGRVPAVIVDASTEQDLEEIAAIVEGAGPLAVPVGSAGLAAAIGARLPRRSHERHGADEVLVVVTSVHPVSRAQLAALDGRVPVILPPLLENGSVSHERAVMTARDTAGRAARLILDRPGTGVVVIGGDGTDALLSALGAEGVVVLGSLLPGVPYGRIRGGDADGTIIATKSGGFGTADTLNELIRILTEETP